MARQHINTGIAPNDGTGDTLKTSFTKCNDNFIELYAGAASYVLKAGDTMTGKLTLAVPAAAAENLILSGHTNVGIHWTPASAATKTTWAYQLGDVFAIGNDTTDILTVDLASEAVSLNATPSAGDNSTKVATTAFVTAAVAAGGGGGGGGGATEYVYQFATTAPPDTGALRFDAILLSNVSALYIHNTTSGGDDIKQILLAIDIGAKLLIQDKNNSANFAKFNTWALPTDNATYTTVSVEFDSEGGTFENDAQVLFHIIDNGTGTVGHNYGPPQGRLTLQSGVPVMITTQAAKTTIYYNQYSGYNAPFYDGNRIVMLPFGGPNTTTTDTTKNPSPIGVNKVNDWFIWDDNGIIRLSHGPDWTNDTTRSAGTALARIFGLWVNQIDITNGPAAYRGTYVGTTRSNASAQFDWIYGTAGTPPTSGFFGVWNAYNRREVYSLVSDLTDSWSYSTSIIRPANNRTVTRHSFVCGLAEDMFESEYVILAASISNTGSYVGVGYDSTTEMTGRRVPAFSQQGSAAIGSHATAALGFHFFQALETSYTSGHQSNFYGDNGWNPFTQAGLDFRGWM